MRIKKTKDLDKLCEYIFRDEKINNSAFIYELLSYNTHLINILNEVDGNALHFNAYPLAIKGVKKGEMVSVRFTSNIPVVISGDKPCAYCH